MLNKLFGKTIDPTDQDFTYHKRRIIYFMLAPLILLISLEVMHLSYPLAIVVFFRSKYFFVKWLITYAFLLCWQSFFYALTQHAFVANLLNTLLMFMIAYTSEVMGRLNGNPLLPSNLLLISNVKEIASFVKTPFIPSALIALLINVWSLYHHYCLLASCPVKRRWYHRVAYGVVAVILFMLVNNTMCYNFKFRRKTLSKMDVKISAFNPIEDYQANGAILTFFPRIGDLIVPQPEGYHENSIMTMKPEYQKKVPEAAPVKANVIIIQNESWWDPSVLPEVTYNKDLLEGIHSLSENTLTGTFQTPVYSGGTCMPEFEVITGIPTYLLPSAAYPYSQYITEYTPSIVSAYRDQGYQTIALHPYKKNFYNRSTAYPLLGFDEFKGIDDFTYQDKSGAYIDDMACVKQIIDEFEGKTSERIMEFIVTMENHGGYKNPRYDSFDFEMEAPTLSEEDYMDLKRFSQGVYNADKSFMALVDYFEDVEEPVIIAMFGDHLPLLGTNGSTYMDSGFVEKSDTFTSSKHPHLYETPYVVWTNYPMPDFELSPRISGNTLGLKVFLASGNKAPWHLMVFDEFSDRYPATVNTAIYNAEMEKIDNILPEDAKLMDQVDLLIYDILHGEQYCTQ